LDEKDRFSLSPAQLMQFINTGSTTRGKLFALLFPKITHRRGGFRLKRLPEQAAAQKLKTSLFRANYSKNASDVFLPVVEQRHDEESHLEDLIIRLAKQVPCFECMLGKHAYESSLSMEILLQQIQDAWNRRQGN
jgi:hypothetical protein